MDALDLVLVLAAGVLAGTINTIVGAGTLITFPLLVAMGISPLTANVSNTVGLVPASVTGAWGYRRELAGRWPTVVRMAALSAVGGIAGGLLLLAAPAEAFTAVVPWLLVLAAALAFAQPRVAATVRRRAEAREAALAPSTAVDPGRGGVDSAGSASADLASGGRGRVAPGGLASGAGAPGALAPVAGGSGAGVRPIASPAAPAAPEHITRPLTVGLGLGVAATGVYGGYFGAAQGVVLLALLGMAWTTDLQRANGAKNVLAGVANLVSATVFIIGGVVDWQVAGLIAVGSAIGGVLGSRVGRRIPAPVLRALIVVVALTAAVVIATG